MLVAVTDDEVTRPALFQQHVGNRYQYLVTGILTVLFIKLRKVIHVDQGCRHHSSRLVVPERINRSKNFRL